MVGPIDVKQTRIHRMNAGLIWWPRTFTSPMTFNLLFEARIFQEKQVIAITPCLERLLIIHETPTKLNFSKHILYLFWVHSTFASYPRTSMILVRGTIYKVFSHGLTQPQHHFPDRYLCYNWLAGNMAGNSWHPHTPPHPPTHPHPSPVLKYIGHMNLEQNRIITGSGTSSVPVWRESITRRNDDLISNDPLWTIFSRCIIPEKAFDYGIYKITEISLAISYWYADWFYMSFLLQKWKIPICLKLLL